MPTESVNTKINPLLLIKVAISGAGSHFGNADWLLKQRVSLKSAD